MSLTGPVFLDGIIVLTIAAFVVVILIWPRLNARTPWHIAGRVGALVTVNLLVLLTAATQLNATYLFFANWADLSGGMTGHLVQTSLHRGGDERRAPDLHVTGAVAPVVSQAPALSRQAGSTGLLQYTVHGPLSGLTGTILVRIPPDYTSTSATNERYPVLEALHGYPAEPLSWITSFHIGQVVDQLASTHQLRQPLIVMPEIEIPQGVDTEGVNGQPGEPQLETWLTRDVPDWVGQHFRVVANRDAWATVGYSAGGFDAAMATVLHPAQYGAAIVLGGFFRPEFGPFYEPFTRNSPQGRYYDLTRTVAANPPPVSLWLETSHADRLSYKASAEFLHAVRRPMGVHAVVLQNAGHRVSVWIALLPESLRWLGQNVQGFRPDAAAG